MLLICGWSSSAQTFHIDGNKAVRDTLYGMWLCAMPQERFGADLSVPVEYDSTVLSLTVCDRPIVSGDSVTFASMAGTVEYPVTVVTCDSDTLAGKVTFTWLPVVELDGEFGYSYSQGTVTVNMPDGSKGKPWLAKLRWRGGYTNKEGKHKRNYHIKFLDENGEKKNHRLFGLRKDNHWKLDAGQKDFLRIRNRVCTDLWLDMSCPPAYADTVTDVVNGSRGQMIEVVLNGEYRGLYNMCEPLDRKQLQLARYDTVAGSFHGMMWYAKEWCRTASMYQPVACSNNSEKWDGIYVKYPDYEDVHPTDWTVLYDAIWFVSRTDAADKIDVLDDSLSTYFYGPTLIDYYLFIVAMQALDNDTQNVYYSCLDVADSAALPLTITPWDLDVSLGAKLEPGKDWTTTVYPERPIDWISNIALAEMPYMEETYKRVNERYWELRDSWLNTDSLVARFQAAVDDLNGCGAVQREQQRWSGDTDLAGETLDINAELEYVIDWIKRRMDYLDNNVFIKPEPEPEPLEGDVNGDGEVTIADVNAVIDLILAGGYEEAADVNGDGEVTIADVNAVIDIILTSD